MTRNPAKPYRDEKSVRPMRKRETHTYRKPVQLRAQKLSQKAERALY